MTFEGVVPSLTVRDLDETIAFYTTRLGFEVAGVYPREGTPSWCSLRAGDAQLMFSVSEPHDHGDGVMHVDEPALGGNLYFYPSDVDALWERVKDEVRVVAPLEDKPWGMREFYVADPNGFTLAFGSPIDE